MLPGTARGKAKGSREHGGLGRYLGATAASAAYLRCDAAKPSKVPPTAGVHTRGPGDGLIVEDGEGQLAVRDEDDLESVYLREGGEKAVRGRRAGREHGEGASGPEKGQEMKLSGRKAAAARSRGVLPSAPALLSWEGQR